MKGCHPVGRVVWSEATKGASPVRAEIIAQGGGLTLFSKSDQNILVRAAMYDGGIYWIGAFLPLRFTSYANRLGYHVSEKYEAKKKWRDGEALPLVLTGSLRLLALKGARVVAKATSNTAYADIKFPGTTYANAQPTVRDTLRSIPPWEMERVAKAVGASIAAAMNRDYDAPETGRAVLAMTKEQRTEVKARTQSVRGRSAPSVTPRAS